jgi:hypothetical protein
VLRIVFNSQPIAQALRAASARLAGMTPACPDIGEQLVYPNK